MFNNLKKKIQGGGASTPVRTFGVAGDQIRKEENDNLSKDSTTDTEQAGSDEKSAAGAGSVHHPLTVTSVNASVKPPVIPTLEAAVEQIKDHAHQSIDLNEIEELAMTQDEGNAADVATLSEADLQDGYSKLQSRSNLYKNRLLQIVSAYKELNGDKEQLKVSISRTEERHRRQISELKEQIQLDSQAKRDLENNYSLMLDEKDEMIQVLRMKIKLMKDDSSADGKGSSPASTHQMDAAEESQLKEKVKRLEALLTKCKDTIKSNKERIQQLTVDRDAMAKQAQEKMDELEKFKSSDLTGSAEHLAHLEDQNKLLQGKVAKLEKTGQEQLEKSREIIRQLKEQKNRLEEEVRQFQTPERPHSRPKPTEQEPDKTSEHNREETEEALKNKITELLEEVEKIRAESEEKLKEANSRQMAELTDLQERLELKHEERINKIASEHRQRLTEIDAENERRLADITKKVEMEFADKMEKQRALLEQQRLGAEKMMSDDRELDEVRRRVVYLEEKAKQGRADLVAERKKGIEILEEKLGLEERVRELEGIVDSQHEVIGRAETERDCFKHDLLAKAEEFNLTVKNYEDEIKRLRKEVGNKLLPGLEENVPDSEVKSMPTGFENIQQEDKPNVLLDLQVEDGPEVRDEADVGDEPKREEELKEKLEPSSGLQSRVETENLELKELNRALTDSLEVERMMSRCCKDEIEQMKADAAKQLGEINQRLLSSGETIAQLEQRMNDAMERENQLNMELETAKIDNEQNLALRNEEIVSLQITINELKNSEQALRDENTLQNDRISALQETVAQLNATEQTLKEQCALQSDEIKSLLDTIGQNSASEETSKEMKKNFDLLSDKVNSLESENEELKTSRKTLEETVAAQFESLKSLESEKEELKTSRKTLEETVAAQFESLKSLESEKEELKTSRKTLEETAAAQFESLKSLESEKEELKTSKKTLEETVAAQFESLKSLESEKEELKTSRKTLEETVAAQFESLKSLESEKEELKTSRKTLEETVAAQFESLKSLESEKEELKTSRKTLEETAAAQFESLKSLESEKEELKTSRKTLEETVAAQCENLRLLESENEESKNSIKTLEETLAAQHESLLSYESKYEELRNSKQTLEETVSSHSKNINLLVTEYEELKTSRKTLEETVAAQFESLKSLESENEELKTSRKALEETVSSQNVEISSLQVTIVALRDAEQALKEENLISQSEEVKSLQGTINQLQSFTSHKEDLKLLQTENSQLKCSEQSFKERCASQSEELSLLQAAIDELRSSEKALKDKNVSQSEEMSLLQSAVDELRSSEKALGEIIVSQSEEMTSLQALTDQLKMADKVSRETHNPELALQEEEMRLLQESADKNRISEQALKQDFGDKYLVALKQPESDLSKDTSVELMGVVIPLDKESVTAMQRPLQGSSGFVLQNIGRTNETFDVGISDYSDSSFRNSDLLEMCPGTVKQIFNSDLSPSVDNVQKYTKKNQPKLRLERQVKNDEEIIMNAHIEKEIKGGQLLVDVQDKELKFDVATENGRDSRKVIREKGVEDGSLKKSLLEKEIVRQQFDGDDQVLQERLKPLEETRDVGIVERDVVDEQGEEGSLEVVSLREQVKQLQEEVALLKRSSSTSSSRPLLSSGIESYSQFAEGPFQVEQSVEHLQAICTEKEKRIKDLEGEVVNSMGNYRAVLEKLTKLEEARVEVVQGVIYDEEMALKLMEKENIVKELEEMKISKKHLEDQLQDLKQEIETSAKMNSTGKTQAQQSTNIGSEDTTNVSSDVNLEAGAKVESERKSVLQTIHQQYEDEVYQVRTNFEQEIETVKLERDSSAKFYETRIADLEQTGLMLQEDLTVLMEKLNATTKRCSLAEKAVEHYKLVVQENEGADLKSQFKMDAELEIKQREDQFVQSRNELEEPQIETEIINEDNLKQMAEEERLQDRLLTTADEIKLLTFVPFAENVNEQSCDRKLECKGTFDSSVEGASIKLGSESRDREFSSKFYEARIADLEETSAMLQEDLTIVMEKLNAMTESYSQAEKAVEHYKQLLKGVEERDLKSECQEDLETELKRREGEIVHLKRELEEQRTESLKLSEKLMQAVEKEKSTTGRLQRSLEEFEKCGAATVGSSEQPWLSVNSERTSAGDVSRPSRENILVEHFKGDVEGVPGQHVISDAVECQLNLLPFDPVPLQLVRVDHSGSELEKMISSSQLEDVPISVKENFEKEFKKLKSDFKSELRQHAMENNRLKELQKELLHEVEVLKSSIQMSSTSSNVKLIVTEPTELEYLRNILYKYMLGMETKTLAKVICTVVKFSADQTRKVLEREDSRNKIFFTEPR